MFTKFRNALISAVGGNEHSDFGGSQKLKKNFRYEYSRPWFLKFTEEEINAVSDIKVRPLILPRDVEFPFKSGYCECINAGKSKQNEDQGAFWRGVITPKWWSKRNGETKIQEENDATVAEMVFEDGLQKLEEQEDSIKSKDPSLQYTVFAIFDGHGGPMVAVTAAKEMEAILHERLESISDLLLPDAQEPDMQHHKGGLRYRIDLRKPIEPSQLIVGALESSFKEMDRRIGEDKENFKVKGGCTALLVLFILGKVYTACAGDSRAIVVVDNLIEPLSRDHTPHSERVRICLMGYQYPYLLSDEYTSNEYHKLPTIQDVGEEILCRNPKGFGYSYRRATMDDLKKPLIYGTGKRARLMGTIGVTRGFGDHELKAHGSTISIKPFLSHVPEIRILDVMQFSTTSADVIIMGSDGLFDVTTNKEAVDVVRSFLMDASIADDRKYVCAAQDLVNYARGKPVSSRSWKKKNGEPASGDDITAWVIPIQPYQKEHTQWLSESRTQDCEPAVPFTYDMDKLPIVTAEDCLIGPGEEIPVFDVIPERNSIFCNE